jgi:Flp pilus assembly protein TadD, contains TPR repeats
VESVAWIAERKDVLSAFFWMLTLCLYVYYTEKPVIKRYLPVLLCFTCALMSKPMVITLPVIMILLDYWPLGRLQSQKIGPDLTNIMPVSINKGKKKNKLKKEALKKNISPPLVQKLSEPRIAGIIPLWQLREKIPFFILSLILVIITLYTPDNPAITQLPLSSRLANAPVSFMTYLEKTFWPHDMAIFYPFPEQLPLWQVLGTTLLIIVISTAVIVMIKRLPCLFVGWLWYAITLLPVIKIVQIGNDAMADRYHYLPSIGIAVMLAWGIPLLIKNENTCKKILFPAATAFIIILSVLTWQQCGYWKNSITLFSHAVQVTKNNYLAYSRLGNAYAKLGQYQSAIENFNEVIRLKPDYFIAYNGRGISYDRLGQSQLAIENYNKAINLKQDYADAYNNRAVVYLNQGNNNLGCDDAQKACALGNCQILEAVKVQGYCR